MVTDIIGRELNIGDHVVFHNAIYIVKAFPKKGGYNSNYIAIKLANPSKTTRAVLKCSREMCLLPKEDILIWKLKDANAR